VPQTLAEPQTALDFSRLTAVPGAWQKSLNDLGRVLGILDLQDQHPDHRSVRLGGDRHRLLLARRGGEMAALQPGHGPGHARKESTNRFWDPSGNGWVAVTCDDTEGVLRNW
jgi:hypothetical protein